MDVQVVRRHHPEPVRLLLVIALGAIVAVGGLVLAAREQSLGVLLVAVGILTTLRYTWVLDTERTLGAVGSATLGDLAVPLPVLPGESPHPHRDLAQLPAAIPAVVPLPGGGWGLLPYDIAVAAASHAGFSGRWHRVAEPLEVLPATTGVADLTVVPRESAAVLVDVGGPAPHGVTGAAIRELAATRRLEHISA